jgi:predicted transcriptional regulator of viral defense system
MNAENAYKYKLSQLYEIAEGQAGYFSAAQAVDIGFSRKRLSLNVKSGKFLRVFRGIYRFALFPGSPFEDLFVAWLRAGSDSVISHESALAVYELSDVLPSEVHITVPRTASRRRKNLRQHTQKLNEDKITSRSGLPVTTVERTIADVAAAGLGEELVRQAIEEAIQRGMISEKDLIAYAKRRGGRFRQILHSVFGEGETS